MLLTEWTDFILFIHVSEKFFERKTEQGTKFWINDEETDGTLIMKAVTNRFDAETFCVLLLFIIYVIAFMKFLYKLFK